jgi:GDPmannose 4,6-dehydratase
VKKALVTGVAGQDGTYLSEFLIKRGYEVSGTVSSLISGDYLKNKNYLAGVEVKEIDMRDNKHLSRLIKEKQFDEVYNLASLSSPHVSFAQPKLAFDVNSSGTLNILEAIRLESPQTKMYQASTSELFGGIPDYSPQDEKTPFNPRSPYAVSKLAAHHLVVNYRQAYGIRCCCGILFNHESNRRADNFVTKKISNWIKEYSDDSSVSPLELGNLNAKRDWGHSKDFIEAMWMMLNPQNDTDVNDYREYVVGTGKTYSIKEFISKALAQKGKSIRWVHDRTIEISHGKKIHKTNVDKGINENEKVIIRVEPKYWRPVEVIEVKANYEKIKSTLGWEPKTNIDDIIKELLE